MKNLFLVLFCIFLFSSCSRKDKSTSRHSAQETDGKETKTTETSSSTPGEGSERDIKSGTNGIEMHTFNKKILPSSIKYKGKIIEGASWTDKNGDNILIITQTDVRNINADEREQYLYAYHYINYDDGYSQLWDITDFVRSYCDTEAEYIPKTLEVVDLDSDGIAETLFIYKLDGRCDVSPLDIKLMMHKGETKLVIRGTIDFDPYDGHKINGEKNFDNTFKNVPGSLKEYASDKWDKFVKEYGD